MLIFKSTSNITGGILYREIWSLNPKFQNFMSRIDRLPAFSINYKIYIVKLPRNWPKLQIFFKYGDTGLKKRDMWIFTALCNVKSKY